MEEEGSQRKRTRDKKRIKGGEYDQSMLYTNMKMSMKPIIVEKEFKLNKNVEYNPHLLNKPNVLKFTKHSRIE
jgi:hypothetical protein